MDDSADVEMSPEPPTSSQIVAEWLEAFERNAFSPILISKYWAHWVPKIYSPTLNDNCLNWQFNEMLAKEILFNPLEQFICNGENQGALEQICHATKHASVCGRFFKSGEPTYSCRECGTDKTCVLCVECFKQSSHRFHKYRMGTSAGGGCCDCGDIEAWKREPFCESHQVNTSEEDNQCDLASDVVERTKQVFHYVMWYAFNRLTTNEVDAIRLDNTFGDLEADIFDLDVYCTILYNDEAHTFDQVINTLSRVLKCTQRNSTEFVTNIDREGRAVVKCSTFQVCEDLKHEIEKYTSRHGSKPLKVLITHAHIIAHQIFAQKLMIWLEKFLGNGKGFRSVFTECILKSRDNQKQSDLLTQIMIHDSSLWKSIRTQWHRLLIAGMLLEYDNKKALAKVFTKNYAQIMKDFIRDDHEHSYSISSISVQLFTVPTLAHHLIANDDVLYILLSTILSEYRPRCNKNGKLEFERNPSYHPFKRTLFMLFDLKYLLTSVPETWNDDLKKCFLHGFCVLVNLLVMMQGMDSVTRQVGMHMEYEPEWESGFNLHIKVARSITHIIAWCATDKVVLVKAYRLLLRSLQENPCYDPLEAGKARELADHSTACLHYDVSSKPISIHLPVTRLLAALHLHLEKYGLHFDSPEFQLAKPTPVQIIEPVLRTQVMIAQVHTGMWRRNGYALLNTLYFYHNVKCRTEMLDRDITLLQIGASLIESNEFLIHLLNKFNLISWALEAFEINTLKSSEEDSMRQVINLVEEFLYLLIAIIGERHMPGVSHVTTKERIKKDILHALCIKQAPHSELVKCISDDLEDEEGLFDEVVQEIAKFNEPLRTSTAKGTYELLPGNFDEFNVFFYHYTREEMSKAEETQRKRRKDKGEIECCPPPQLPKLCESFSLLVNLLQCDVMLRIMKTVMERCQNLRARSFSENQLHKVLHLIGYGLQEEESGNYPFFKFVENASKAGIFDLMEELLKSCPRVDAHRGLLQWTLQKYQQVAKKEMVQIDVEKPAGSSENKDDSDKQRRARLAAEKRAKIMAQMAVQQKNFLKENAQMFENINMEYQPEKLSESSCEMDVTELQTVALGPNRSACISSEKTYTCILCQEEERITAGGPTMVLAAFVHQATVLNKYPKEYFSNLHSENNNPLFLAESFSPAPYTSTCGHVMHSECWRKFFDNVMVKEHRRPYRLRHPSSFDVDKQEFLCPLCECLSNTVLPVVPPLTKLQPNVTAKPVPFQEFLSCLKYITSKRRKVCHGIFKCILDECSNLHCTACIDASSGTSTEQDNMDECEVNCILQPHQVFYSTSVDKSDPCLSRGFADLFKECGVDLNPQLQEMVLVFAQVTYTRGLNVAPHPSDKRLAPMAWKSLAYTTRAIETVTSYQGKPLLGYLTSRQRDSLENLVKVVAVLGSTWSRSQVIKSHTLNLISVIFEHPADEASILDFDPFGFLIALTLSMPSLLIRNEQMPIPMGGILEWHILRLMFIVNIVKTLLTVDSDVLTGDNGESATSDEVLVNLLVAVGKWTPDGKICSVKAWETIKELSKPFLRSSVLFYHYLTEVPAPNNMQELDGDTFENMCIYLNLPSNPHELFDNEIIHQLVQKWTVHPHVMQFQEDRKSRPLLRQPETLKLIDLPYDYIELLNAVSSFVCPNSDEECRNPTMCLVCGTILCSQSYCCQTEYNKIPVGACNRHAAACGAGVGIFLRIRDCELLLLATPHRGCFMSPPYLDEHGETDQGLRRGNPLKLNLERYEKLHMLWLNHSIHEEIARQIETSNHIVTTQWNML
ncbi:E3 ubiquitin-protein ligase UBR2 isoform X2 [Dendroctonus ponderosae]|nr:E3 ubiquitin-protein ligase UBR2 isoform X2 [Dendroctonus ponderosae]XP_048517591.1 E3 ubiquitin-protein ligase UBR2 isoform X2 [Dendroctonus ponderosae]XP_048517592.1 E3 ubiquitin-protein ligase UBR2 isoform X2 [Dendroctonus ponderosae]